MSVQLCVHSSGGGEDPYNWASRTGESLDNALIFFIQVTYFFLYTVPEPRTFLSSALVVQRVACEPGVDPLDEMMTEAMAQDEANASEGIIDTMVATSSKATQERAIGNGDGEEPRLVSPGGIREQAITEEQVGGGTKVIELSFGSEESQSEHGEKNLGEHDAGAEKMQTRGGTDVEVDSLVGRVQKRRRVENVPRVEVVQSSSLPRVEVEEPSIRMQEVIDPSLFAFMYRCFS